MAMETVRVHAVFLVAALVLAGCGEASNAGQPGWSAAPAMQGHSGQAAQPVAHGRLPEGVIRLRPARIVDPGYFGRPMTALSLMIPADWQDRGTVEWAQTLCHGRAQRIQWEGRSPDGRERLQIAPAEAWSHTTPAMFAGDMNQGGCPDWSFTRVADYLQAWAQHHRPGSRVLDFELDAGASRALTQMLQQQEQQLLAVSGIRTASHAEVGQMLLAHHEGGVERREAISTILMVNRTQMAFPDPFGGPDTVVETISGMALPVFAASAPAGQLDFARVESIGATLRLDPAYWAEVSRHMAALRGIEAKGAADRHAINMDTINYIGGLNRDSYNSRIASMERGSHQHSQAMREVQTWVDPVSREPIELPMHYRNAWRLNDGSYLMTNNDGFDPWRDLQLSGDRMQTAGR